MTALLLAAALLVPATPARASSLDDAKSSQAQAQAGQDSAARRKRIAAAGARELAGVLDGLVSSLEKEGLKFDRVQGDNDLNPMPELIKTKVALERHRGAPRVILLPKGGPRVYGEVAPSAGGYAVSLSRGAKRETISGEGEPSRAGLEALSPKLREALLKLIAAKEKP